MQKSAKVEYGMKYVRVINIQLFSKKISKLVIYAFKSINEWLTTAYSPFIIKARTIMSLVKTESQRNYTAEREIF